MTAATQIKRMVFLALYTRGPGKYRRARQLAYALGVDVAVTRVWRGHTGPTELHFDDFTYGELSGGMYGWNTDGCRRNPPHQAAE